MYSDNEYAIHKIKQPNLFALETDKEFNILSFENLFADKLTTIGPTTIGISDERADEQFKQIYDVITLFIANVGRVISNKELIKSYYEKVARVECQIHDISYDSDKLFEDMNLLINRVKNVESDGALLQRANDFQGLYLRRVVNKDRAGWAIVGYQLAMLIEFIFHDDARIKRYKEIIELINKLSFSHVRGPE